MGQGKELRAEKGAMSKSRALNCTEDRPVWEQVVLGGILYSWPAPSPPPLAPLLHPWPRLGGRRMGAVAARSWPAWVPAGLLALRGVTSESWLPLACRAGERRLVTSASPRPVPNLSALVTFFYLLQDPMLHFRIMFYDLGLTRVKFPML